MSMHRYCVKPGFHSNATQAIAFEWKPGFSFRMCVVDVETLDKEMVDSFRSVLIVLPRGPSDDENYSRFIEHTRNCSYNPPFCAPKPPFEDMKVPASLV